MDPIAIAAKNLGKQYFIGGPDQIYDRLGDQLFSMLTAPIRNMRRYFDSKQSGELHGKRNIWALRNVSFTINKGEVVGIIGGNGAGKSTLLKLFSRITDPTEGYADIYGRVGSLLEVGTGFHPELTGRENIFLNGSILGMGRNEIKDKFDEIVEFSEIEQFIDTPVKHYSSGMYVRLAFAVAANLETDILLVDEVLAVGDMAFQKKCLGKMSEVSQSGRTVLFVSHNMGAIQNLCSRGIVIKRGNIIFDGKSTQAVATYINQLSQSAQHAFQNNPDRSGSGIIRLNDVRTLDEFRRPNEHLVAGRPASIEFYYVNPNAVRSAKVAFSIYNELGVPATNFDMFITHPDVGSLGQEGKFICQIPNLPLPIGQYRIEVGLFVGDDTADLIPNALMFNVSSSTFFPSGRTPELKYSSCMVHHTWEHEAK